MSRVWVLDTATKGTGAEMVPLDQIERKPAPRREPFFVPPKPKPREPKAAEPRVPRRFRVVDVATRRVLADGVLARETLDVLGDVRSIVDVSVSVWEPEDERWRLLALAEQRLLWERRSCCKSADSGYERGMAKDHGPSIKNDKQYEGLRKKGMSKSRAARIANSEGSSSRGGKKSGSKSKS
jgi:hypothetical protein